MTYMAYIVGKPESPHGKKVILGPLNMSLEKALIWLSEKYNEINNREISSKELDMLQSKGELDIGQYYLCLDRDIEAFGENND